MIFLAVQSTAPILTLVGNSGLFFFFCLICTVKTIFIILFVPETHGRRYAVGKAGPEIPA